MLAVMILLSVSSAAQTADSSKSSKLAGSISGKVTIKGKGMSGITVGLRRSEMFNPSEMAQRAVTDQDGNYKITNIAAGSYQVVPSSPAYVLTDTNTRARSIIVSEGENVENINFSLLRGGVITGRITDADSRPLIQQRVKLSRVDQPAPMSGPQAVYSSAASMTDDRGIYRIYGITPGRYKVSVGQGADGSAMFSSRSNYKEVFYPDVTESSKASIIEVGEGSETANIDIALGRPIETFSASGRVISEKGDPIPFLRCGVQRLIESNGGLEYGDSFTSTNARGEFTVEALIPGNYTLFVMQDGLSDMRTDGTTFDVIDSDVSGITIRLSKGASVSGTVALENDDKQALAKLYRLQIVGYVESANGSENSSNGSQSPIGPDGSFRLAGLPGGTAYLNIGPFNMGDLKGFVVSRVERDGVAQPRGLAVGEGEQVSGIRVIVDYGTAVLRGRVNVQNGTLPAGARITVRLATPGYSSTFRPLAVDERFRFVAEEIPAGTYELSVMAFSSTSRLGRTVKQQVVLQNNSVTDVTISFDLSDVAKP
jgi:protocatechuate 3,4-dioxygenase beta subunit